MLQENNDSAAYLSENEFLLKLAYLCDVFDKLNKLNVSMQGPDKNVLDISDKIETFIKSCLCGKMIWKTCLEVLSISLSCPLCLKKKDDAAIKFTKRICATSIQARHEIF